MIDDNKRNLVEIARKVFQDNPYLTMATSSKNGDPWVAPMMYAADKEDNFYWVSAIDAVHSQHIAENPSIALVLFDSNPGYGNAQALYCKGSATLLKGDDLKIGCDVFYSARYPDPKERKTKGRAPVDFSGESPRRMYRAHVDTYSILHPDKHPVYGKLIDHRVEVDFKTGS